MSKVWSRVVFLGLVALSTFTPVPFASSSNVPLRRRRVQISPDAPTGPDSPTGPDTPTEDDSCFNAPEDVVESTVLVEHTGFPGQVTDEEIAELEQAFVISYNQLISCSEGFRTVENVTIDMEINPGLTRQSDGRFRFSFLYRVFLRCVGCRSNPNLFLRGSRRGLRSPGQKKRELIRGVKRREQERSLLAGPKKNHPKLSKSKLTKEVPRPKTKIDTSTSLVMERTEDPCFCSAPEASTFADTFDDTLIMLQSNGALANVDSVEAVTELEELDCSQEITTFESTVIIEHTGTVAAVTPDEITAMQDAFVEVYNNLNALNDETCDMLFRVADTVVIVTEDNSGTIPVETQFNWVYQVTGRCRGCEPISNVLVPGTQRFRFLSSARDLQENPPDTCFCPTSAMFRPPTETEFQVVFDESVQLLQATGAVTNIVSTNSAMQVMAIPTAAPTTGFPSFAPLTAAPSPALRITPRPTAVTPSPVRLTPRPTSTPRVTPNPTSRPRITPNPTPNPTFSVAFDRHYLYLDDDDVVVSSPTETPRIDNDATKVPGDSDLQPNDPIACVAVLDESAGFNNATNRWQELRQAFPNLPFCLLQPNLPGTVMDNLPSPSATDLVRPHSFDSDANAVYSSVMRNDRSNQTASSDWFDVCGLSSLSKLGITEVSLFVGNSNTGLPAAVVLSLEQFIAKLSAEGIQVLTSAETINKDWITPCLEAALNPLPSTPAPTGSPTTEIIRSPPPTGSPTPPPTGSPTPSPSTIPE